MLKLLSAATFLMLLTSCQNPPENEDFVPVVGLNSRGKSAVHYLPTKTFQKAISPYIGEMASEVTATLEKHETIENTPWSLSRVTVGLGLETELDLFEIVEGEVEGVIELRFQKH
ncbi:MAG: hypothetical protein ACJ76H_06400 [Bacteriovoracaceae bacterium]